MEASGLGGVGQVVGQQLIGAPVTLHASNKYISLFERIADVTVVGAEANGERAHVLHGRHGLAGYDFGGGFQPFEVVMSHLGRISRALREQIKCYINRIERTHTSRLKVFVAFSRGPMSSRIRAWRVDFETGSGVVP